MIPQDGSGYGKSQYWEWKARALALETDEACKHLEHVFPKVTFKYDSQPDDEFYLHFRVKCPKCRKRFYTTEIMMKKLFIDQYRMNSKNQELSKETI